MGKAIFDRAPDAEVFVPEGPHLNRYQRYGNVWFWVTDLERHIVTVNQHWLLSHIERLTLPTPAPAAAAGDALRWQALIAGLESATQYCGFGRLLLQYRHDADTGDSAHAIAAERSLQAALTAARGLVDAEPEQPRGRVVVEEVAKIIYDAMREVQPPSVSTKPWVEHGNAISQDVARYHAKRILALVDAEGNAHAR